MTQEEKAKRYDEAIEKLRSLHEDYDTVSTLIDVKEELENIFPELKESEDERMVKFIKKQLFNIKKTITENYELDAKLTKAIDWLEKQGEHANFISKIQVGDKVTRNEDGVLVNLSQLNMVAKKDEKQGEQKPAWSEEDETKINYLIALLQNSTMNDNALRVMNGDVENWLKFLRPQSKQEWSKEDKNMLQSILDEYKSMPTEKRNWLRTLKNRVLPKKEWSEEDDYVIERLFCLLDNEQDNYPQLSSDFQEIEEIKNKLKSLKERYAWKPSDEQINALRQVISGCSYDIDPLVELETKLKEL